MNTPRLIVLALALAGAGNAQAADPETEKELQALKARVEELEKAQKAAQAGQGQQAPAGMTPEQQQELGRVTVKVEGLEDAREASGLKGLKIGGYMDPVYSYNADLQQGQFQLLTPASVVSYGYASSYIGTVGLDFQKETENGTKLRITLVPARSSADIAETVGGIVHEASFSIPLGSLQTRLIGGQIPDWSGYEYLAPTQNKLVTHNLLFDFTLPGFYTGAGLELVRGKWTVKAMIANLSTTHRESFEHIPVLAYRGDYYGGEFWGFGFAGVNGKARNYQENATGDTWLDLLEVDGWYTRGALNFQGQVGAGHQKKAAITPDPDTGALRDAMWIGASALVSYKFTPRLEGAVRADYIMNHWNGGGLLAYSGPDDRNGIGPSGYSTLDEEIDTGEVGEDGEEVFVPNDNFRGDPSKGADRFAVTVGGNYGLTANATVKAEYRFDGATQPVFRSSKDTDPTVIKFSRTNHLLSASLVLFF